MEASQRTVFIYIHIFGLQTKNVGIESWMLTNIPEIFVGEMYEVAPMDNQYMLTQKNIVVV